MLEETVSEFMNAKASATPRRADRSRPRRRSPRRRKRAKRKKNKPSSIRGLEEARAEGENQAIVGARKIDFPFYFPTLRTSTAAYQGTEPRTYTIRDERRSKHDAYRLVVAKGIVGEYYGIQGTTWRYPPILDDPHETIVRDGRELMVYRDGKRIRLDRLAHAQGRLLGLEHAHAVGLLAPDARHRHVAEATWRLDRLAAR